MRIFTPTAELPFAGHPTLGTCHAWLEAGGAPTGERRDRQECAAGLVRVRRTAERLAFAAPPLLRSGPVDEERRRARRRRAAASRAGDIVDAQWADNGPGWVAVLLETRRRCSRSSPGFVDLDLGVVGPHPDGGEAGWRCAPSSPRTAPTVEDPVTGSLNASVAQWLLAPGARRRPYVGRAGHRAGSARAGSHITQDADGTIWVGGGTVTCVSGQVELPEG